MTKKRITKPLVNPAFVLSGRYNGLSIIQELGRRGVEVYALDSTRSVGSFSRYARFWRSPDPLENEDDFINFLLEKGEDFEYPPVLFPARDHWVTAVSKHRDRLQPYYISSVPGWEIVELLIRKDRFYPWALKKGYPVPRLYHQDELLTANSEVFPVVAKRKYRGLSGQEPGMVSLSQRLEQHRMVILKDKASVNNFVKANRDILSHIIFQEYIPGMADRMYTVGIYASRKSDVLGVFTGRKVRGFPPDIGDCVVGQAEKLPSELVTLVKKMVRELNYQGLAEFEFKRDLNSNEFKLLEINPRSWSWIGITPACGVNLPWMAYADLTGTEAIAYQESVVGDGEVKYINVIADAWCCLWVNKRAGFPEYQMGLGEWLKSLRAKKRVYAEFAWDDPLPGLSALVRFVIEAVSALPRKVLSTVHSCFTPTSSWKSRR